MKDHFYFSTVKLIGRQVFRQLLCGLFLTFTLVAPVTAAELHYLSNPYMALALLPPPPSPGSEQDKADLAEVLSVHAEAKSISTNVIEFERHLSVFTFRPEVGSFLETNRCPKAEWFFHRVLQDSVWVVDVGKDYWERPRPYVVVTNLAEGPPERFSGSYPSGHSALATVCALLLADIFPEKAEAILSKGTEIGRRRVILAKHYPTDIVAGRVLGQRIVQEMRRNRQFRHDFREAKSELRSRAEANHL